MQKHYSVTAFVYINLRKTTTFFFILPQFSIKCGDYGSLRCLSSCKATFRITFEQNCESTIVKKAINKDKD